MRWCSRPGGATAVGAWVQVLLVLAPVVAGGSDLARPTGMAAPERICVGSARAEVAGSVAGELVRSLGRSGVLVGGCEGGGLGVSVVHAVLVVDDDFAIGRCMGLRFQLDGYEV